MKKFILFFLIPFQLSACPGCIFKSIVTKIQDLCEVIDDTRELDISKLSEEHRKYYFLGQREAYCDIIEIMEEYLFISHHDDE